MFNDIRYVTKCTIKVLVFAMPEEIITKEKLVLLLTFEYLINAPLFYAINFSQTLYSNYH